MLQLNNYSVAVLTSIIIKTLRPVFIFEGFLIWYILQVAAANLLLL